MLSSLQATPCRNTCWLYSHYTTVVYASKPLVCCVSGYAAWKVAVIQQRPLKHRALSMQRFLFNPPPFPLCVPPCSPFSEVLGVKMKRVYREIIEQNL